MILRKNKKILFLIVVLAIFSLLNMYNAALINDIYQHHFIKQFIWYILGFIVLFVFARINIHNILKYSLWFYLISILLLILVLFLGEEINGARAWFDLKFFSFQPSEFTKLTLTLLLVNITNNYNKSKQKNDFLYFFKITFFTLVPSILVFMEPDTGAIIFYLIILFVCLFNSKIQKKYIIIFLILSLIFAIFFICLYLFNKDLLIDLIGTTFFYRVDRIINFNSNYQIDNALILIGSSGLFGCGLNETSLYVPESPTDFIYAYNIGNFGLLGFLIVTTVYLLFNLFLINNTKKANNKLLAYVFISIFIFQQLYNILMNIGLLPIMGIPLPLLSYGGSSLIIYFIFISFYFKAI